MLKTDFDDWFSDKKLTVDIADPKETTYSSRHESTPDHEKGAEEVVTMHEKMYRMATARNNPFHVGGSENAQSDIDYVKKHSPWPGGSENFQGGSEQVGFNNPLDSMPVATDKSSPKWEETAPSEYEP